MPLLDIQGLEIDIALDHGRLNAVRDLDLSLEKGECLGIVGESGSGKSLTALAIVNLLPRLATRRARRLRLGDDDLLAFDEATLARRIRGQRVGFVFQDPMNALNPVYTIGRQLEETMALHATATRQDARRRSTALLERVGIADPQRRLAAYPHELSGGQRQRVVIAMALMNRPELLIADEPTTALDVTVQAQILALLAELQAEFGMGMLLISHNLGAVSQIADRVAVMYAGDLLESAPSQTLFADARHPYTRALLNALPGAAEAVPGQLLRTIRGVARSFYAEPTACVFADRCESAIDRCREARPPVLQPAPAHWTRCIFQDPAPLAAEAISEAAVFERPVDAAQVIDAKKLSKAFRLRGGLFRTRSTLQAVREVSLSVERGETLAIVGESGCGKSTLARLLLGLETPDAGAVTIDGQPLATIDRHDRARHLQLVFQDPYASLNPSHTVRATVRRPLDLLGDGPAASRDARVTEALTQVGLPSRLHGATPGQLSGGQRQRVAIARALITAPKLIVCDEPTSALDVSVQAQILNLLLGLRERLGLSLLLISHDLAVVAHLADRIAVMYLGEIVESGAAAQILRHPLHPYTQALLDATPAFGERIRPLPLRAAGQQGPAPGCAFASRCPRAIDRCRIEAPVLREIDGRQVACHRAEEALTVVPLHAA